MEQYKLVVRKSVSRDMKGIPKKDASRIVNAISALAYDAHPPGSKMLSGQERYRLRQGNYRILYEIHDQELIVCVVKVGHRRNVYK
ncbi:MAG: type II toxin-antitoxin system RelE/ParE family toxin [Spartobacteria bacterium]|nr:type II toxin-antitoxin system RelE/ParE family toxin [Spartobacteria bacterium]